MATVQEWDDFTQDAAQKLETARQNMENVLNDPQASQARKDEARANYEKQKMFYDQLAAKNEEVQISGIAPVSWTIDAQTAGSALYQWSDNKYYPVEIGYPLSGKLSDTFKFVSSEHFDIEVTYTYPASAANNSMVSKTSNYPPSDNNTGFFGLQPGTGGTWVGYFSWTARDTKGNLTNTTNSFNYDASDRPHPCCAISPDAIPSLYAGRSVGIGSWNGDVSTSIIAGGYISISIDGATVDDPWDYYNDILMPDINPDDRMYPDGYEPEEGPGPGDDPDDGPVEEEPPDKTDWGAPELPYTGGFYTSNSFCNYAAFTKIGINALRVKLWDQPDGFWDALSMVKSNAANWLDYFVNIRAYPYRIVMDDTLNRYLYVGRGGKIDMGGDGSEKFQYKVPTLVRVISWSWKEDTISKHYNNFLDFSPYTKAEVYLPFSGTWEINPTWLYHTELVLLLAIDITDGSGTWQLMAYRDTESAIVLRKQCKVGIELPISGNEAMVQSSAIVSATLTTAQHTVNNVKTIASGIASAATSKGKAAVAKEVGSLLEETPNMVIQGLSDSANMAFASKEKPSYSGGSTGAAAAILNIVPSIKVHRPIAKNPDTFGHTVGNLVNKASKLEKLSGFTICRNVDISNVPMATDKEKAELKRILENGFYA